MEEDNKYFNFQGEEPEPYMEADNVITRFFNPQIAENREFEKENYLMDKGNAFNEYMFNKANEYNSAAAQMKRGVEAGINPMLLAAGIAGTGASAAPMQSQSAGVGMNTNVESPFDMLNKSMSAIDTGTSATDKLGKLIGFGKENKLNFKIADKTAKKLSSEIKLNRENYKRLHDSFKAFIRQAEADANATEQNVKNLEKLWDLYQEQVNKTHEEIDLVKEEKNTQHEQTRDLQYKNWENEFKKQFRETFGVQLNDSDTSMLAQLVLNGHGQELIDALFDMFGDIVNAMGHKIFSSKEIDALLPSDKEQKEMREKEEELLGKPEEALQVNDKKVRRIIKKEAEKKYKIFKVRKYWQDHGGFNEFLKFYAKTKYSMDW